MHDHHAHAPAVLVSHRTSIFRFRIHHTEFQCRTQHSGCKNASHKHKVSGMQECHLHSTSLYCLKHSLRTCNTQDITRNVTPADGPASNTNNTQSTQLQTSCLFGKMGPNSQSMNVNRRASHNTNIDCLNQIPQVTEAKAVFVQLVQLSQTQSTHRAKFAPAACTASYQDGDT